MRWNQAQKDFLKENFPKHGRKFCAEQLNISVVQVKMMAHRLGLTYILPPLKVRKIRWQKKKNQWYRIPKNRVAHCARVRSRAALKGIIKTSSTQQLLGCSFVDFKKYLENKFSTGMSWENYGQWHIDHIRPCASFNLLDPEQQKQCFHYSNMQPLWAKDNIAKRDKWTV